MDFLLSVGNAGIVAAVLLALLDPVPAAAAARQPDRVTIGNTARPDRVADPLLRATRPTPLTRAPSASPRSVAKLTVTKATGYDTVSPVSAPPSAAQREKLASRPTQPAVGATTAPGHGVKPQELFTLVPPAPFAPSRSNDERIRAKHRPGLEGPPAARALAGHRHGARGPALDVEGWPSGMSTKPDEARTLGAPSPTPGPAPGAAELQRGAAPTLATPRTKAPNVSTSGPRDPAPPTRVDKKRPVRAAQEVRP